MEERVGKNSLLDVERPSTLEDAAAKEVEVISGIEIERVGIASEDVETKLLEPAVELSKVGKLDVTSELDVSRELVASVLDGAADIGNKLEAAAE